jgi:hypothetical protein
MYWKLKSVERTRNWNFRQMHIHFVTCLLPESEMLLSPFLYWNCVSHGCIVIASHRAQRVHKALNFHSRYSCNIFKLLSVFTLQFTYQLRICPQMVKPFHSVLNLVLSFHFPSLLIDKATNTAAASLASRKRIISSQWLNSLSSLQHVHKQLIRQPQWFCSQNWQQFCRTHKWNFRSPKFLSSPPLAKHPLRASSPRFTLMFKYLH